MKKIFSLVLCFTLVLSIAVGNISFAAEDVTTEELAEVVVEDTKELLIAKVLGFIDANVKGDEKVTRAQLAYTVANMIGLGDVDAGEGFFEDVKSTSSYAKAINILGKLQIFNGNGSGMFLPDEIADKNVVATIFVRALGYDVVAAQNGGWAMGYLITAQKIGLFNGVNVNDEMNMTSFARIVCNAMHIEIMGMKYSSMVKYEVTDNTILDLLNIVEMSGVVTANEKTGLTGYNNTSEGRIRIGNHTLFTDDEKLQSAIGKSVQVYYQEIDGFDKVMCWVDYDNDILEVDLSDVDTSDNIFLTKSVEFVQENNKERKVTLDSDFAFLYNDVYSDVVSMSLINNKSGSLKLIDNDSDSKYDVLFAYVYTDYVVSSVNEEDCLIVDKFGKMVDLSDNDIEKYEFVDIDGNIKDWSALYEWTVISIYDSAVNQTNTTNRHIKVVISNNNTVGRIDSLMNDNGEYVYVINDVEYTKSDSYVASSKVTPLSLGLEGTFYLNAYGAICAYRVDALEQLSISTGVIIKAAYIEKGFTERLGFRIYDQDGEAHTFYSAEKIEIDGNRQTLKEAFDSLDMVDGTNDETLEDYMVIRYKLNDDDEITFIDTRIQGANEEVGSLKRIYTFNDPELAYRGGPKTFGRKLNLSTNTKNFSVPSNPDDEESYFNKFSPVENRSYSIEAYATNSIFEPCAILLKDAGTSSIKQSEMCLVTDIRQMLDGDGESAWGLIVYTRSGETTYTLSDDIQNVDAIANGDVIAVGMNSKGQVDEYQMIYDRSEHSQLYADAGFQADERVFSGTVFEKQDSYFSLARLGIDSITDATKSEDLQNFNFSAYPSYVYEEVRGRAMVRKATIGDVLDYLSFGSNASFIIGSDYADWPRMIIVYK